MSDTLDLDALEALCDEATPGPWVVTTGTTFIGAAVYVHRDGVDDIWTALVGPDTDPQSRADAEFVAAARQAIPALIAEIGRLRAGGAS